MEWQGKYSDGKVFNDDEDRRRFKLVSITCLILGIAPLRIFTSSSSSHLSFLLQLEIPAKTTPWKSIEKSHPFLHVSTSTWAAMAP